MDESFNDEAETVVVKAFSPGAIYADAYCIERVIARSGTTCVYDATEISAERPVVLKVLRRSSATADTVVERFEREGAILKALEHPAVVRLFRAGAAADGTLFLAMERLAGETLKQRLKRESTLSFDDTLRFFSPIADAVDAAHARGIVHRDLKPENVFLPTGKGAPAKILDFGLSSLVGDAQLTQTGDSIGTPKYMAPEQIVSTKTSGSAVDIYALGVCVYECLTGKSPFGEIDRAQLLGAILHGRSQPLSMHSMALAEVDTVLAKAMSVKPEDRYPSAGAFMVALRVGHEGVASSEGATALDHISFRPVASVTGGAQFRPEMPRFSQAKPAKDHDPRASKAIAKSRWPVLIVIALAVAAAFAGAVYAWLVMRSQ